MLPPEPRRPSLLFIDDEPRVLNAIRAVFKSGYDVALATSGFDALALLHKQEFDVIVSDQRMPGMTGVEFFRRAKRIAPNTVRILLSGFADMDALMAAVNEVEIHRFVSKPWDNASLRAVVADAVEVARAMRPGADHPTLPEEPRIVPPEIKEGLVVVDAGRELHDRVEAEFGGRYHVIHCETLVDSLALLHRRPCTVLVCRLDVSDHDDMVFLMQLKQHHPGIMLITVCEATDAARLVALINRVGIFRFLREPGSFQLLTSYLHGAFERARRR
jgi:DNA-binding NtrC family response regulator